MDVSPERTFDRIHQFDPRSRMFSISSVVPRSPRSYTWRVDGWLDQGTEGACVGFAWSHEAMARPVVYPAMTNEAARNVYRMAQKVDEWDGEAYEGTSVLAGAKIMKQLGFIGSYRWAFGLEDLKNAVGYAGPAVLGVNWYTSMFNPDGDGFLRVNGQLAGGHAILAHGVNVRGGYFKVHNSWGKGWGQNGEAKISFDDMDLLLRNQGEACVPMQRSWPPVAV